MQEQYLNWLNAIQSSTELSVYDKQSYSDSVIALSKTGSPVVLTPKHLALLIKAALFFTAKIAINGPVGNLFFAFHTDHEYIPLDNNGNI